MLDTPEGTSPAPDCGHLFLGERGSWGGEAWPQPRLLCLSPRAFLWELHPAQKQAGLWASVEEQAEPPLWGSAGQGWVMRAAQQGTAVQPSSLCFPGSSDSLIKY